MSTRLVVRMRFTDLTSRKKGYREQSGGRFAHEIANQVVRVEETSRVLVARRVSP